MVRCGLILALVVLLGNPWPALPIDETAPHPGTGNGGFPGYSALAAGPWQPRADRADWLRRPGTAERLPPVPRCGCGGDRATIVLDRSGYEIWEDRSPAKSAEREDNPRHWGDGKPGNEVDGPWQRLFVDCLKEGKRPPVELEQSHKATVCCHLANIAYRTGHKIRWDGDRETCRSLARACSSAAAKQPTPWACPASH
jgi:hypothetical protein